MKFAIVRPNSRRATLSLASAVLLAVCLRHSSAVLTWAGDVPLDFVGHLISGLHIPVLDPLDPTYQRCF